MSQNGVWWTVKAWVTAPGDFPSQSLDERTVRAPTIAAAIAAAQAQFWRVELDPIVVFATRRDPAWHTNPNQRGAPMTTENADAKQHEQNARLMAFDGNIETVAATVKVKPFPDQPGVVIWKGRYFVDQGIGYGVDYLTYAETTAYKVPDA